MYQFIEFLKQKISKFSLNWMIFSVFTSYMISHVYKLPKLPQLYANPSGRIQKIVDDLKPFLEKAYFPTPWAYNRHLNTIIGSMIRKKLYLSFERY